MSWAICPFFPLELPMAATVPDYGSLSSAVDFSGVTPMIISSGAAGITMLLAFIAVKYVRRIVRSS